MTPGSVSVTPKLFKIAGKVQDPSYHQCMLLHVFVFALVDIDGFSPAVLYVVLAFANPSLVRLLEAAACSCLAVSASACDDVMLLGGGSLSSPLSVVSTSFALSLSLFRRCFSGLPSTLEVFLAAWPFCTACASAWRLLFPAPRGFSVGLLLVGFHSAPSSSLHHYSWSWVEHPLAQPGRWWWVV